MLKSASARRLARIIARRAHSTRYTVGAIIIRRNGQVHEGGLVGPAALKHLAKLRGYPHAIWCY